MSRRTRGIALSTRTGAVLAVVLLAGACGSSPVAIQTPEGLPAADQQACEEFVAALPDTLAGEDKREIEPSDALGAAYGDPAITVSCGVPKPADFNETSSCEVEDGVGWFVPPEVFDNQSADVTMTAAGYRPVVQLRIPHTYRPDGPAAAIAELGADVDAHLVLEQRCQ